MKIEKIKTRSLILQEFFKPQFRYKGMPVNFLGLPAFCDYPKSKISNEFSRMKRLGLIEKEGEFFRITIKGQKYVKRKQDSLSVFDFKFPTDSPRNMIVMFANTEGKKAEREWFRFHLKKFGYIMIQRSVWVGPSPFPKDFSDYLNEIKLKE